MNARTQEAYKKGEEIGTRKNEIRSYLKGAREQIERQKAAIQDQARAIARREIGAAEYHAKRIEKYREEIDAFVNLCEIAITESNGSAF